MKGNREAALTEILHLAGFPEKFRARGNQKTLPVLGIDVVGQETLNGSRQLSVEAVDEHGFKYGSFKQDVSLPYRRGQRASRRGGRDLEVLLSIGFGNGVLVGVECHCRG